MKATILPKIDTQKKRYIVSKKGDVVLKKSRCSFPKNSTTYLHYRWRCQRQWWGRNSFACRPAMFWGRRHSSIGTAEIRGQGRWLWRSRCCERERERCRRGESCASSGCRFQRGSERRALAWDACERVRGRCRQSRSRRRGLEKEGVWTLEVQRKREKVRDADKGFKRNLILAAHFI